MTNLKLLKIMEMMKISNKILSMLEKATFADLVMKMYANVDQLQIDMIIYKTNILKNN